MLDGDPISRASPVAEDSSDARAAKTARVLTADAPTAAAEDATLIPAYLPESFRGEGEGAPESKKTRRSDADSDEAMVLEINLLQGAWEPEIVGARDRRGSPPSAYTRLIDVEAKVSSVSLANLSAQLRLDAGYIFDLGLHDLSNDLEHKKCRKYLERRAPLLIGHQYLSSRFASLFSLEGLPKDP